MRHLRNSLALPLPNPFRLLIVSVCIGALLALSTYGLLSLSAGAEIRQSEQHLSDSNTADFDTSLVGQSFQSRHTNLARIDVQASSFNHLPASGQVRLLAGDGLSGTIIYSNTLDTVSFAANPYLQVEFPPIAASQNTTYTLTFETPGQPLRTAFALRYNSFDALSAGTMYTDGGPGEGDLVITTYYQYGPADAAADFVDTVTGSTLKAVAWLLLLLLPGLALLAWLPSRLTAGQRVLAAPAVTLLALPVFFLVTRAVGLPLGSIGMWILLIICAVALVVSVVRRETALRFPAFRAAECRVLVAARSDVRGDLIRALLAVTRPPFRHGPRCLSSHAHLGDVPAKRRYSLQLRALCAARLLHLSLRLSQPCSVDRVADLHY